MPSPAANGDRARVVAVAALVSLPVLASIPLDVVPLLRGPAPYPPEWQWAFRPEGPARPLIAATACFLGLLVLLGAAGARVAARPAAQKALVGGGGGLCGGGEGGRGGVAGGARGGRRPWAHPRLHRGGRQADRRPGLRPGRGDPRDGLCNVPRQTGGVFGLGDRAGLGYVPLATERSAINDATGDLRAEIWITTDVPDTPAPPTDAGTAQTIAAIAVTGAGAAAMAVGTILAVVAKSDWDESEPYCDETYCDHEGVVIRDEASTSWSRGGLQHRTSTPLERRRLHKRRPVRPKAPSQS